MTQPYIKNIGRNEILRLPETVDILPGQVVSKTLAQNDALSLTLFAFDKGEEISAHRSEGDAMITALFGSATVTVDGREHILKTGDTLVMPAGLPHAVKANEGFKMFLVVVFPQKSE